jgi:EmrB/QacA subfamily drug resistance transporter
MVAADGAPRVHARRWSILGVLGIAQLMVILDSTIVSIALPSAQHDLGFSNSDRQWVVTAFALTFGSLLLVGGRLADLIGRKRTLLVGLAGFASASALGGAATSFGMLVTARAVQGAFGALLAPAVLALLTTTFTDPGERSKAFGIFGAIAGMGASLGLLLGGVLTEYADWRWTLYVNLVFAAVSLAGAAILLPSREHRRRTDRIDVPGTFAVTLGLFALVFGFSNADRNGWSAPLTVASLVMAGVLLIAFVLVERIVANPILPLRVVLDRNRGGSYVAMFASGIGLFSMLLFLTYYMQESLGYSAIKSGLAFMPSTAATIVTATIGSALIVKVSARVLIPLGMTLAAVGMWWLTHIGVGSNYESVVLPALLMIGAGLGLVFATGFNVGILGVRSKDAGVASATVNATQQVGGSVGTALFNTLAATAFAGYLSSHLHTAPMSSVRAHAAVHSYTVTFWVGAAVFLAGVILSGLVLRNGNAYIDAGVAPPD